MLREEYKSLSVAERVLLVEDIWDSIAEDTSFKLSAAQKKLLDEREKEALAGNISKRTWAEIKATISSR
jgi:putative addiction module component (TIGR02574 family)